MASKYRAGVRRVQITSNTAVWYQLGKPVVAPVESLSTSPKGDLSPKCFG
jgi:hypothetical protein